jgi:hypothetical protein
LSTYAKLLHILRGSILKTEMRLALLLFIFLPPE